MFPILSPGALVVIDQGRRRIFNSGWNSEFERPIYFFEHREGYAAGEHLAWRTQPHRAHYHQHLLCAIRKYVQHPAAKSMGAIGQVTSVAMTGPGKQPAAT